MLDLLDKALLSLVSHKHAFELCHKSVVMV